MPSWPASLPQEVLAGGYGRAPGTLGIRSNPERGRARQRKRFSSKPHRVQVRFQMTVAQLATFETFWEDTLGGGALSFDFFDPEDPGETVTANFVVGQEYQVTVPDDSPTVRIVSAVMEIEY